MNREEMTICLRFLKGSFYGVGSHLPDLQCAAVHPSLRCRGLTLAAIFIMRRPTRRWNGMRSFSISFFPVESSDGDCRNPCHGGCAHCLADGHPCLVEKCRGAPDKAAGSLHFSGIILLISVYELVAHGGLTAYRDEMPLHYFGGSPATTLLIWLPCLVLTLIP